MGPVLRFFAFFTFFLTVSSLFAQTTPQFTLNGSYSVASQSLTPTPVNFTIEWNERGNMIEGTYSDNYFSTSTPVTGTSENYGRTLNITFPTVTQGIRSISMTTSQTGLWNNSVPLTVTTRNAAGVPVDNASTTAAMTSQPINPQAAAGGSCMLGFGTLSGYCGLYSGTVTENSDPANRCNLIGPGSTRLEMSLDGQLSLYFNFQTSTQGLPAHRLGPIPNSPLTNTMNRISRNCGSLTQTAFSSANCQTITLNGTFLDLGGTRNFTGTYTIMDEANKESCTYSMNLNRALAY